MTSFENYLSEETSKMERTTGGWSAESNATISHAARFSRYTETLTSDVQGNSMKVTATGSGNMTVATEQFNVEPGVYYKAFEWVTGVPSLDTRLGLRFYDSGGVLLGSEYTTFTPIVGTGWNGLYYGIVAPENAVFGELFTTFESAAADDVMYVCRPSVMQQTKITPEFVDYALYYVPDYMMEADLRQRVGATSAPTPMTRYVTLATKQLSDAHQTMIDWDYVDPTFTDDGEPSTSTLVDPYLAEPEWLPWLAQLMGVSLDTIPAGGRSPWLAFTGAGIDTWTEWEEDVDPGSIPGIPDTEWVDIETFSPDFYETENARRLQIASGFNGVLGGTSESIMTYVAALLNTDEEDPFVYVVKHHGTNPYRILVSTLATEDPDPNGNMIELAVEAATPAGTNVVTDHGVSVTARSFYHVPKMFYNMWTGIPAGGSQFPLRFIENGAANGKNLAIASITSSPAPFMGGGVGLARWLPGFALYSGAVRMYTESAASLDILGDLDVRIRLSDVTPNEATDTYLVKSPNKWAVSVTMDGNLKLEWEASSTTKSVESADPIDWGNADRGPFWIRATLDTNNGAGGHRVSFYMADTLYENAWTQIGEPVNNAGTTTIDSDPTPYVEVLGKATNPEDSVAAIVYRTMVLNGIEGTIVLDLNLSGEFDYAEDDIYTGTDFFRLPLTNMGVTVDPALSTATNMVESEWTSQAHGGLDDYFYFGISPYKYDSGNLQDKGDEITVSGLASDIYDWTINKLNGGTITGSTGTVNTITWSSDDYGGTSILSITVREQSGQTVQAFFSPDYFEGASVNYTDTYGADWDLTRRWWADDYFEYSAFVDRDYISPTLGAGVFTSGMIFDADETITVSAAVRRFWSGGTLLCDIVDHITTSGWKLRYNRDDIEAVVTDGTTSVTLEYNEVLGGTLGEFVLVTLLRDVGAKTISLWINETMVDSVPDPFTGEGLFATTGQTGIVGDDDATYKFDLHYLGMFDRNLSAQDIEYLSNEMAHLFYVLPQATQSISPDLLDASVTVVTPLGVAAPIRPALLNASPTYPLHTVVKL